MASLIPHLPQIFHNELRASRYYVSSSDSILIQCDTHRSQADNRDETWHRLNEEITQIYHRRVPGLTSPEQKKRVEDLQVLSFSYCPTQMLWHFIYSRFLADFTNTYFSCSKKAENFTRLKIKKKHSDKKRSRKGGGYDSE